MDSDLLGRLLDQYSAALALFARQWCLSPDDVVQEAFLKLAGQRVFPQNPAAWLFRAVRNGAMDAGKAARRRTRHESRAAAPPDAWFVSDRTAAPEGIDAEEAAQALQALPIAEREIIIAHLWGGLTFEQAAVVAGCSSSAAHRLYSRGLSMLRERLGVSCHRTRPIPE